MNVNPYVIFPARSVPGPFLGLVGVGTKLPNLKSFAQGLFGRQYIGLHSSDRSFPLC